MKAPSIKKLTETFDLSTKEAKLIRKFAKAADDRDELEELVEQVPETDSYVRSLYSSPFTNQMWRDTVALHAIDVILGGHGVEAFDPDADPDDMGPPRYEYVNMGDTYAATLIFDREKDRLSIGTWGDIAERSGNPQSGGTMRLSAGEAQFLYDLVELVDEQSVDDLYGTEGVSAYRNILTRLRQGASRSGNPQGGYVLPAVDIKVMVNQLVTDGRHLLECGNYHAAKEAFDTAYLYAADASMSDKFFRAVQRYRDQATRGMGGRAANPRGESTGKIKSRVLR